LYEHAAGQGDASAALVLARLTLATDRVRAEALWLRAADLEDTRAVPELVRLNLQLGDATSANRIRQYGLHDDGSAATSFLW
jgi:hypothetical protein